MAAMNVLGDPALLSRPAIGVGSVGTELRLRQPTNDHDLVTVDGDLRLLGEPAFGQRGAFRPLPSFDHRHELRVLLRAGRHHVCGTVRSQRVEGCGERAAAMQVQDVLRRELAIGPGRRADGRDHVVVDDPVQRSVPVGGAPFELSVQDVAA